MYNADLESKPLEILKAAASAVNKVMVLNDPSMNGEGVESVEHAAHTLGVEVIFIGVSRPEELEGAFATASVRSANGLAVMASPFLNFQRERIIEPTNRHRLPSIRETDIFSRDGGLISYGPNFPDMYRCSATYVAKILKGARPADLPVEQPTRFELVINMKAARTLGLTIPPPILALADEVIE
jgi:putative ABC transport system substrate-binding protein